MYENSDIKHQLNHGFDNFQAPFDDLIYEF